MSLNSKVIYSCLFGGVAAFLGWLLFDFSGVYRMEAITAGDSFLSIYAGQAVIGALFGCFVGLGIGLANGIGTDSPKVFARNVGSGAAAGLAAGLVGLFFGQLLYGVLNRAFDAVRGLPFLSYILEILTRAVGWAIIGMIVGYAQGLPSGSKKTSHYGAIGGLIGGFLGGMVFVMMRYLYLQLPGRPGVLERGIGFTITGAFIGFFVGLIVVMYRQAWVRVIAGRNEGKEYIISKQRTTIGRDELSDIGLFGDTRIEPIHAMIDSLGNGRYLLKDSGSSVGTMVGGAPIKEHLLKDGEVIEIGTRRLLYHEKATASSTAPEMDVYPGAGPSIPQVEGTCPFCGGKKDAVTGACGCSVGVSPAPPTLPGMAPPPAYQPPDVFSQAAPVSQPRTGTARLVGMGGSYDGQVFMLSSSIPVSVGREPGRDIQLSLDNTISRKHASIVFDSGYFTVVDEGSSNGTTVNGMRITRQELVNGDVVKFGNSVFKFEQ